MIKILEIDRCVDCKYYPGDGFMSNAKCDLTGEQLTADWGKMDGPLPEDPIDIFHNIGGKCPLPTKI